MIHQLTLYRDQFTPGVPSAVSANHSIQATACGRA